MFVSMRVYKVWHYAVIFGYVALNVHYIPRMPTHERLFTTAAAVAFFLIYLLVPALFGARLEPVEGGLFVEQYRKVTIPYSDIKRCYGVYLFPQQLIVIVTNRGFPLTIVLAGDRLVGKRKSPLQVGELATLVRSRMAPR